MRFKNLFSRYISFIVIIIGYYFLKLSSNKAVILLFSFQIFILTFWLLSYKKCSLVKKSQSKIISFIINVMGIFYVFVKDKIIVDYLIKY